ncbi:MAG TPA: hypothetical protein VMS17_08730 [Gemmataceae bacterium]|nr:hypothetical protein [Gemmataceae bacterium]
MRPTVSVAVGFLTLAGSALASDYFAVKVVDDETGRGVPLIALRTVNGLQYWTDSNGLVAFREPGLMGMDVFFSAAGHGYEYPADGFGNRGAKLHVEAGGSATLKIHRINIAERLYRLTGGGIYADSVLLGEKTPLKAPVLDGQVFGSDSVLNAVYRGKIYWFWGDTNRPAYPLGLFNATGAVSELPSKGGLDPETGVDLAYFTDDKGLAKEMARMPGKGPTWLVALTPLTGADGRERLYASCIKVEPPFKVYARGLAVFDDDKQEFVHLADWDMQAPVFPAGHAFRHTENGVDYVYFANPYPLTRVAASPEHFGRAADYETYTCLRDGSRLADPVLDRDADGGLHYAWRKNTPAVGPAEQARLIADGKMKPAEALLQLRDRDTDKPIYAHAGSVYWNEYRKRWVMITVQQGGSSFLGEVWYAEAAASTGPWLYAVKIATHDRYSFYNPKQDPMFDKDGGKVIFFEGTYSDAFSGNPDATPRYDYNQMLYKLDLSDPRLAIPTPICDISPGDVPESFAAAPPNGKDGRIAFFAPDRPFRGGAAVLAGKDGLHLGGAEEKRALFYALPPDAKDPPTGARPLYVYRQKDGGGRAWSVDPDRALAGYVREERPLCLVWRRPE